MPGQCLSAPCRTLSSCRAFPSLVHLTNSSGGLARTGQRITPRMPMGRGVSGGIAVTWAGSGVGGNSSKLCRKSPLGLGSGCKAGGRGWGEAYRAR